MQVRLRTDYRLHLLVAILLLQTYGCGLGSSSNATNNIHQGEVIEITVKGKEYSIPPNLEFDNQVWVRESDDPESIVAGVTYTYIGNKAGIKIRYHQWPDISEIKETIDTLRRKGPKSLWKIDGKCLCILQTGAWVERMVDFERSGREYGTYKSSYENGVLKFSGRKEDDIRHGPAKGYYPDGSLWWKGVYRDAAIQLSETIFFDRDGSEIEDMYINEKEDEFYLWKDMSVTFDK